jgi:DNA topoisomerase VI subunit B
MSQKLSGGRRIFSEPQAAQYFYTDRLAKMTGRTSGDWHRVVVKELMDNALDAAESAGRVPVVGVAMDVGPSLIRLSVQDNGVGIPADVVGRMLDFSVFASDKAVYRTPTRGQQGNALKTIVGMPQAMGLVDCPPQLSIDALGVQHRIKAQLDGAGHPDIDLQQEPSKHPGPGSTVEVLLPTNSRAWMKVPAMLRVDVRDLLRGYHLFNPHARVTFSAFALGIDPW